MTCNDIDLGMLKERPRDLLQPTVFRHNIAVYKNYDFTARSGSALVFEAVVMFALSLFNPQIHQFVVAIRSEILAER